MLLGIAGLCACSRTVVPPAAASLALPARATGEQPLPPFEHVVIVVQENRSFDDLFATYPGADGALWGRDHNGRKVALKKGDLAFDNLGHTHFSFDKEYDRGRMDGFDLVRREARGGKVPAHEYAYRYVDPAQIQPYWTLAREYVLADHMFPTQSSGSFSAHQDLIAGDTTVAPGENVIDFPTHQPWGCDAPSGTVTSLVTSSGHYLRDRGPFPCFDYATLRDLLDAKGVSWKYFTPSLSSGSGRAWNAFDGIRAVRYGSEWTTNVVSPQTKIFQALRTGTLPAVSWVIPDSLDSDHPGTKRRDTGPSWVARVVDAIGESPYWKSTAVVVLWDDWGGEFDHVAPPQLDSQGLGFRVPCLIVSPYSRAGYVSHTQYEFGSLLRFVEDNWHLGRLGTTDERANGIGDVFDLTRPPRAFVPVEGTYSQTYFERRPSSGLPVDDE